MRVGKDSLVGCSPLPRSVFLSLNWRDILPTSPLPEVTPVMTPAPRLSCPGLSKRGVTGVARLGPHGVGDGTHSHQPPFLSRPGLLLPARLASARLKGWHVAALLALVPSDRAW